MTDPLFGKQKPGSTAQSQEQVPDNKEPMMDFWGGQTPPSAPVEKPAPASLSTETLPAGDALMKPFEAPEPVMTKTPEESIVTPPTPQPPADEENVRKISSATFRRLDEPVNLSESAPSTPPTPEPSKEDLLAPPMPVTPPPAAPIAKEPTNFELATPPVEDATPPASVQPKPITVEPVSVPVAETPAAIPAEAEAVTPPTPATAPIAETEKPAIAEASPAPTLAEPSAEPQTPSLMETAPVSENLWAEPTLSTTPAPEEAMIDTPAMGPTLSKEPEAPLPKIPAMPETVMESSPLPIAEIQETAVTPTPTPIVEATPAPITEEAPAPVEPAPELVEEGVLEEEVEISDEMIEALEEKPDATISSGESLTDFTLPPVAPGSMAGSATMATPATNNSPLQQTLQEHQQWLDSQGAAGKRAHFRENEIAGMDLSHQRLSGASFRGANLKECRFTQSQLEEADFSESVLEGADFTAAILDAAIFHHANANHSAFSAAQANHADFSGTQLQGCNFTQAKLSEAQFREADLSQSNLQQVTANLANFRDAKMQGVNLNHSDLTQATLRGADLTETIFDGANLLQTQFQDAVLTQVNLGSTDFSQSSGISAEAQSAYMQVEREHFQQEMHKLDRIRGELEQRERTLINEREQLQRQLLTEQHKQPTQALPDANQLADRLQKSSKLFLGFGIGWFILTFILAIILQNVFSQLENGDLSFIEILLMGTLSIVPLIFFAVSMSKSLSLSYALRKLTEIDPHDPQ